MPKIYWAGDSTVAKNTIETWPQTGIGQEFERFLRGGVRVENFALNGRSTKSFMDEGHLDAIAAQIQAGDFLFIQFGHNDEKPEDPTRYADPETGFPENLGKFVAVAREKGATPVIITPVTRFDRNGPKALYHHACWAESACRTGEKLGVAVIDLTTLSEQLVDSMGAAAQTTYFMNLPAGVYPHFPKGQHDNTHLQPAGAVAFGALIARELHKLGGEYAAILNYDFPKYLYESDNFGVDTGSEYEVEPQDQPAPKA